MKSFILLSYVFHGVSCLLNSFLNCPENPTACTDKNCGKYERDTRAGYVCDVWPFYAGGFSKRDIEEKYYLCLEWSVSYAKADIESNITISHAWCSDWLITEKSELETEVGTCACSQNNNRYCTAWTCSKTEYSMGDNDNIEEYECGKLSNGFPKFCYEDRDTSSDGSVTVTVGVVETDIEPSWCICNASTNYRYCDNWYCEEESHKMNAYGKIVQTFFEYEHYTCLPPGNQPNKSIANGKYYNDICWKWSIDVDGIKEFEVAECYCKEAFMGFDNSFCSAWRCSEMGIHKRRNQLGSNFYLAFILWCIFGSCCFCAFVGVFIDEVSDAPILFGCACCLWFIVIGFVAIAHGGFVCFVFFVGFAICCCSIGLIAKMGYRYK